MYKNFFNLKQRPFKLVPNPEFLYLSKSHEEALAHLTFSISNGDGFVTIIGEVGTGKTTLCRTFLEKLDENIEIAYIFNPPHSPLHLLKTINNEFGIQTDSNSLEEFLCSLNNFLIDKRYKQKQSILLIDEAQNLSQEILEQIRLLSNLETNKEKLLQIILIGQPELEEMLDSYELRQLAQRITLNCRLLPLTYRETKEYIRHRISVASIASINPSIKFTTSAFKLIYQFSSGIPRLINIICERALIIAYSLNKNKINLSILRSSIKETITKHKIKYANFSNNKIGLIIFFLLFILFLAIFYSNEKVLYFNKFFAKKKTENTKILITKSISQKIISPSIKNENNKKKKIKYRNSKKPYKLKPNQIKPQIIQSQLIKSQIIKIDDFDDFIKSNEKYFTAENAIKDILCLWKVKAGLNNISSQITSSNEDMFIYVAQKFDFSVLKIKTNINIIKNLNLPAILEIKLNENLPNNYISIFKIKEDKIYFALKNEQKIFDKCETTIENLSKYWTKKTFIFWKNVLKHSESIKKTASKDSIISLKTYLRKLGFKQIVINSFYDKKTKNIIKDLQKKANIDDDGVVGVLTKIVLINQDKKLNIPHITKE